MRRPSSTASSSTCRISEPPMPGTDRGPIVIVGAGQAGVALAAKLRALGYDERLMMIGAEPVGPYQRPPLSKKYVSGELALDRLLIRPPSWYAEQNIELRLSTAVAAISRADRSVRLTDGTL